MPRTDRIEAARAARRFPRILELLAEGAITLTAVGLLAPHLTSKTMWEFWNPLGTRARGKWSIWSRGSSRGRMCRHRFGSFPRLKPRALRIATPLMVRSRRPGQGLDKRGRRPRTRREPGLTKHARGRGAARAGTLQSPVHRGPRDVRETAPGAGLDATLHSQRRSSCDLRSSPDLAARRAGPHQISGDDPAAGKPADRAQLTPYSRGGEAGGLDPRPWAMRLRGSEWPLQRDRLSRIPSCRAVRARWSGGRREYRASVRRSQRLRGGGVPRSPPADAHAGKRANVCLQGTGTDVVPTRDSVGRTELLSQPYRYGAAGGIRPAVRPPVGFVMRVVLTAFVITGGRGTGIAIAAASGGSSASGAA